ncbi:hypothetical protein RND71_016059 [Anisodus tanguticus]|uniref:BZIP domain-containing protein n=1 Tax=Anisodus tanguticus TaxID=243964 RepID=A0AAE1S949_9SOLA|nr:hypothetical protein RND71_016059 [Anisodus tanguticus]
MPYGISCLKLSRSHLSDTKVLPYKAQVIEVDKKVCITVLIHATDICWVLRVECPNCMLLGCPFLPFLTDEKELKRQRRKQSNRESARRSRLRKQVRIILLLFLCLSGLTPDSTLPFGARRSDELAQRAEVLKEENASLRAELSRLRSEHDQLAAQNASLKERLGEVPGRDDPRPSRNDISLNKDIQHSSQTEPTQGGQ